jgi:DNA-binding transcriptional ArsR family regulator
VTVPNAMAAAVALGHPTRRAIIAALSELGEASPRELARATGVPLNHATYHVKVLSLRVRPAAIVKVRSRQVRGATQGFYRLAAGWDT